jgi:DNA-binding IclR family transcriptional regulator
LAVIRDMDIRAIARPTMEELCRSINETVNLLVLHGTRVLFVDGIEAERAVRVGPRTGVSLPAHVTSAGKAMLAHLSIEQVRELYPKSRLEPVTSRSLTSRRALESELELIRAQGYATNIGESEPDVCALSAAILDSSGRPRGALGVSIPASRYDAGAVERDLAPVLLRSAATVSGLVD